MTIDASADSNIIYAKNWLAWQRTHSVSEALESAESERSRDWLYRLYRQLQRVARAG